MVEKDQRFSKPPNTKQMHCIDEIKFKYYLNIICIHECLLLHIKNYIAYV